MLGTTTPRFDGWDDLPLFLTIDQTAEVLQIGRSKTYELTVEWEHTHLTGLPCIRFGSQKRVPREVLREFVRRLLEGGDE